MIIKDELLAIKILATNATNVKLVKLASENKLLKSVTNFS